MDSTRGTTTAVGSTRLRGSASRPLSQDSVWERSAGDGDSPNYTTPAKLQRVGNPSVPTRGSGADEARTPLTTTASSRPTVAGSPPIFGETPTPPAKEKYNQHVANMLHVQQQELDIATMAIKLAESRRKLDDRYERKSNSSAASKAHSRRASRVGRPHLPVREGGEVFLSQKNLEAHTLRHAESERSASTDVASKQSRVTAPPFLGASASSSRFHMRDSMGGAGSPGAPALPVGKGVVAQRAKMIEETYQKNKEVLERSRAGSSGHRPRAVPLLPLASALQSTPSGSATVLSTVLPTDSASNVGAPPLQSAPREVPPETIAEATPTEFYAISSDVGTQSQPTALHRSPPSSSWSIVA